MIFGEMAVWREIELHRQCRMKSRGMKKAPPWRSLLAFMGDLFFRR
jgi:hypothetical protein